MPSSISDKSRSRKRRTEKEPHDISQLGLDFIQPHVYIGAPRKEIEPMNQELIEMLENRINDIVEKYSALKAENARLNEEVQRFLSSKDELKSRIDAIIGKLEGI